MNVNIEMIHNSMYNFCQVATRISQDHRLHSHVLNPKPAKQDFIYRQPL